MWVGFVRNIEVSVGYFPLKRTFRTCFGELWLLMTGSKIEVLFYRGVCSAN